MWKWYGHGWFYSDDVCVVHVLRVCLTRPLGVFCAPQPSSRCATPSLSAATLASLGGSSSRRGSVEAGSVVDPDASMSELRVSELRVPPSTHCWFQSAVVALHREDRKRS